MTTTAAEQPTANADRGPAGTQVIGRSIQVLRLIARRSPRGARLNDVAGSLGLTKPTAHRILARLQEERLVEQDSESKHYRLGFLAFELGLTATYGPHLIALCRPALERLAAISSDSIYLVVRSGLDATCIDRVEGSFPIRTITLTVGGRRALGVGAAGAALLAALDSTDVRDILARNEREYAQVSQLTPDDLWRDVLGTRRRGYSHTESRVTQGVNGIGMAVANGREAPFVAISIAAISSRLTGARIRELVPSLRATTTALATVLSRDSAAARRGPMSATTPNSRRL